MEKWQGTCEDCTHWHFHDDGFGHCGMHSSSCATSIMQKAKRPIWFLHRFDVPVKLGGMEGEEETNEIQSVL